MLLFLLVVVCMRRKDREVKDFVEIVGILARCEMVTVSMVDDGVPYAVPVSFGYRVEAGRVYIYFHAARAGRMMACLKKDARVFVEAHVFKKVEPTAYGITARYESVMGAGVVRSLEGDEKVAGLRRLCVKYGYPNYPIGRCKGLENAYVYEIAIDEMTGKSSLNEENAMDCDDDAHRAWRGEG